MIPMENCKDELLDIFVNEEDKKGMDILDMSNFFETIIGKVEMDMNEHTTWDTFYTIDAIIGEIAAALKNGFDISKIGTLIADYSHFSQDIIDGLKAGIYHIGQSKEVSGNYRPAILDENGNFIKFFTLKKAIDPSAILSNVSTLSMQTTLQKISLQIEDISKDIKYNIDFSRRIELSNKFIFARDKIILATNATQVEKESLLGEADTYLMEGLLNLYSDIDIQINHLAKIKGPFASIKTIDSILSYINEDMQMIPRYVALRVYLLDYRGKTNDANRIIDEYRYQLQKMNEKSFCKEKYSALELIHKNFHYNEDNVDFWLEMPKRMILALDSCQNVLQNKDKDIFYINMEDDENE